MGPRVAICGGSAEPAFPGTDKWRCLLAARIWWAPTYGDNNIGATHRDAPLKYRTFLFVDIAAIGTFCFYYPIKIKLTSVVAWNRKHWTDLTRPILHTLTLDTLEFGNNTYGVKRWDFYFPNVIFAMNEAHNLFKTLKCIHVLRCITIGFKQKYGHKTLRSAGMNLRRNSSFTAN